MLWYRSYNVMKYSSNRLLFEKQEGKNDGDLVMCIYYAVEQIITLFCVSTYIMYSKSIPRE